MKALPTIAPDPYSQAFEKVARFEIPNPTKKGFFKAMAFSLLKYASWPAVKSLFAPVVLDAETA